MIKRILTLIVAMVLALPTASWAASTQVDSLIQKLVDKGILDKAEARELKMEIAEDAKALQDDAMQTGLPDWVKTTKLKGDVRVRYQYEKKDLDADSRHRGRVRYRLGLENQVNPQWKVGGGLASAAVDKNSATTVDDPRSTNMSFEDSFSRGTIRLDYAYAEYKPAVWGKAIAGKFLRPDYLWAPTDMLWDGDINPSGASVHLEHKLGESLTPYLNVGGWVIDENNKTGLTDPYMHYVQTGANYKEGDFGLKLAGVYYGFNGVQGAALDGTASSNTLTSSVLKYDYDAIGGSAEFSIKNPTTGVFPVEQLAFFGDYIFNLDSGSAEEDGLPSAVDEGTGWAAGVKFGDEKVAGPKQWQVKYQLTSLGKDAWPDAFPDSDRLGGATDIKGQEWELTFGLSKNVTLGLDYYYDRRVKTAKNPQQLLQADLNVKF